MKNLKKLLFAAVLIVAALASAPSTVQAVDWCPTCFSSGDCFACCRCDGGTVSQCLRGCG